MRLKKSFEIGGSDYEQLCTFEENFVSNASKVKYMSFTIVPHLFSKDSAGKVDLESHCCESWFLGATVILMLMPMPTSIPWCVICATRWIANYSRINLSSLIQARGVLVSYKEISFAKWLCWILNSTKLTVFSYSAYEGSRMPGTLKPCLGTTKIVLSTSTMNCIT